MAARDYRAVIARLRRLLSAQGSRHLTKLPPPAAPRPATLAEASAELDLPKSTLHDQATRHNLPRRRRALDPEKRRKLEQAIVSGEYSISKIARLLGVSKSTASTTRRQILDRQVEAELSQESDDVALFAPRPTKEPRWCPACRRKVTLWPCVVCHARSVPHDNR